MAPPEVLEAWKQAGADPAKPPAGCQVRRNRRFKGDPDVDPEWILLEAPVASNEDVVQAEVVADPGMPDRPGVAFKLAGKAARRLDEAAAKLSARKPKGRLAIVLEGEILMLPAVQTPKLGASGQIAGLADREAAERCAKWLQGAWFEVRLLAEGGKDPGTAEKILRDELELKAEDLERQADGSVRLGTARKLPDAALYRAWSALRAAGFTLKAAK